MDIKQILTDFQAIDTTGYTEEQLDLFAQALREQEEKIAGFVNQISEIRTRVTRQKWQILAERRAAQDQAMAQTMAEKGYKRGAIFYIDRHDGLYVVESVNTDYINFRRRREGSSWGKIIAKHINKIDPRLTPLRTQGPFKVGETVAREGKEYRVEGYLGYRMVLSYNSLDTTMYTIIQKKDEKTFKALIL